MSSRISIIGSRGIPNKYGGFEKFTEKLSTMLVNRGYQLFVSCEPNEEEMDKYLGVNLFYFPMKPPSGGIRNIYEFIYDGYSLFFAARNSDIIYMLGYSAALLFFIPKLFGKQLWVNPDGIEWKRTKFNFIVRYLLKLSEKIAFYWADEIIADSKEIKRYIKSQYNLNAQYIPYGAENEKVIVWNKKNLPNILKNTICENNYWLLVARLEPENNIHVIIKAYIDSNIETPLVVVGDFSSHKYKAEIMGDN